MGAGGFERVVNGRDGVGLPDSQRSGGARRALCAEVDIGRGIGECGMGGIVGVSGARFAILIVSLVGLVGLVGMACGFMARHGVDDDPTGGRPLLEHVGGLRAQGARLVRIERAGLRQALGQAALGAQPGGHVLQERGEGAVGQPVTLHAPLGEQPRPAHRCAQMRRDARQGHLTDTALVIPRGELHQLAPILAERR
ncbi:hypothetical protein DRB87_22185 [Pandoraea sp. XY-2]|nr:hypothetical protein DRB87_22185 [Pandoraea sp. XY-2]